MAVVDTITTTKVTVPTFIRDGKFTNGELPADILRCPDLDRSSTSLYWRMFAPVSWAMTALQVAAKADGIAIPVGNPTALGNDNIVELVRVLGDVVGQAEPVVRRAGYGGHRAALVVPAFCDAVAVGVPQLRPAVRHRRRRVTRAEQRLLLRGGR